MAERDEVLGTLAALVSAAEPWASEESAKQAEAYARAALERYAEDGELVVAASAALLRAADRRGLDAPPREDGPAAVVAEATSALVAKAPAELAPWLWINHANALRRLGPERDADAQRAFANALELAPGRAGWWLDLGLLHKWRGRWGEARASVERAAAQGADPRRVAFERAITSTALGERAEALAAWETLGVPMEAREAGGWVAAQELPPVRVRVPARPSEYGLRQLRVDKDLPGDPEGRIFELVWVAPLSPVHGVVSSPTFEDAPVDYGDVVLWDAAPVPRSAAEPTRAATDEVPVFPLLEVLARGEERRLRFIALVRDGELDALLEGLRGHGLALRSFAHVATAGEGEDPLRLVYGKWVLEADLDLAHLADALTRVISTLRASHPDRPGIRFAIPGLYEPLDSERAGKEHQAWRTIERLAEKRLGLQG